MRLDASIPANNWKIIELYNKIKKGELDPSPDFQRKLVWKKLHKFKFIETILSNYPFPEIYIAPGTIDINTFELQDIIVDGQQRCNAIKEYIESTGVFSFNKIPIKKYSELTDYEKGQFLAYEVSIRYLKNTTNDQVREIFQRINNTEYSLNKTERLNAQWGESEFICFAKQIIEEELDLNTESLNYEIDVINRTQFIEFFHGKNSVFNENDVSRMLALQYFLTTLSTIVDEKYFKRNDRVQHYIEEYFDEFMDASTIEENLRETIAFIDSLDLARKSYWLNKANLFTLIVELYQYDTSKLDSSILATRLYELETMNLLYNDQIRKKVDIDLPSESVKYFEYAREAVNETVAREYRGKIVKAYIEEAITKSDRI